MNLLMYGIFIVIVSMLYNHLTYAKHPLITGYLIFLAITAFFGVFPETKIKQKMLVDKVKGMAFKEYYYFRLIFIMLFLLVIGIIIYFITQSNNLYSSGLLNMLIILSISTFSSVMHWKLAKEELRLLLEKNQTTSGK
ncbi:hypothetical protein [Macrococcus animalis]|uniref:hypothetical protein n=1 Tax=Macrococcus animalis TaxID=3395467 RepID=UPI0039BEB091